MLKPVLQGCASLFPAKREVKREVGKACQAWPGNQTSEKVWLEVWLTWWAARCWQHFCGALVAACVPRPSQVALQKAVVEKVGFKFRHAVYIAKPPETMFSELAVGFENFRWRG